MTGRRPPSIFRRYRVIRRVSLSFRRLTHRPIFKAIPLSNKWLALIFLILIPAAYLAFLVAERVNTTYYLFTGPPGGVYNSLGPSLAAVLNRPDKLEKFLHMNIVPDFVTRESCGALDNIYYINQGVGQLGFAEDGLPLYFEKPQKCSLQFDQKKLNEPAPRGDAIRLRSLMPLYKSPLHVIARKELPASDVRRIPPMTNVYIGPEGGATSFISELVLGHNGIPVARQGKDLNFKQALAEMIAGRIEVGFFLTGLNSEFMRSVMQHPEFKILTIENAASMKFLFPYLEVITIPGGTYQSAAKDTLTIGTKTILVTSTELSDHEVYAIADKISHNVHDIIKNIPFNATKVADTDPQKDLYYPLHDGALRFYSHNPPFFLDPHALAGIGSYLTILFALYKVTSQFIRNYRVHRILNAIERAVVAFHIETDHPRTKRFEFYIRKIKFKALGLLRHQRVSMDDFDRINEYIKGHSPTLWWP